MLTNLEKLRVELDQINRDLAAILIRRFEILDEVARVKKSQSLSAEDQSRVQEMKKQVGNLLAHAKGRESIMTIFESVFSEGLKYLKALMP